MTALLPDTILTSCPRRDLHAKGNSLDDITRIQKRIAKCSTSVPKQAREMFVISDFFVPTEQFLTRYVLNNIRIIQIHKSL